MTATFVVEDGTAKTNANAYCEVSYVTDYVDNYGTSAQATTWGARTEADQQLRIRQATQYLDRKYGQRWRGVRHTENQSLDHPRDDAEDYDGYIYTSNVVASEVQDATAHIAGLFTDTEFDQLAVSYANPGSIRRLKQKAGPVEQDITYTGGASQVYRFSVIDQLLANLVRSGGQLRRA